MACPVRNNIATLIHVISVSYTHLPIKIGVIVQSAQTSFIRMLIEGTQKAAEEVGNLGAEVLLREIDTMDAQRQIEICLLYTSRCV